MAKQQETQETAYPVRKALWFTKEQWARVETFRFDNRIKSEAEAVRHLIDSGLEADAEATKLSQIKG